MSQIIAATVFVDLEGDYLDIRYFIACLKLPLIFFFFKFHATKSYSKYRHQGLDW